MDETWIHHYHPETKEQSNNGLHPGNQLQKRKNCQWRSVRGCFITLLSVLFYAEFYLTQYLNVIQLRVNLVYNKSGSKMM